MLFPSRRRNTTASGRRGWTSRSGEPRTNLGSARRRPVDLTVDRPPSSSRTTWSPGRQTGRIENMPSISVLNGPNLNLLGTRKPEVYGYTTLAEVEVMCTEQATELGLDLKFLQSNYEGQLIDWIHEHGPAVKSGESIGVVYNPGAHTHYSYAIRDAIEAAELPVIELHISNVHAREEFRHHSVISPVARGIIVGFGVPGYSLAIRALYELHEAGSSKQQKSGART